MKKLFLNLILGSTLLVNAQAPPPPPITTNSCGATLSVYGVGVPPSAMTCGASVLDFYTNAQDTTLIYLNYWISKPTIGSGVFDNISLTDAQIHVAALNAQMDSLYAPLLVLSTSVPYIKKTKIRFVLKNFAFVVNNNTYANLVLGTTGYNITDKQAINCIWGTHPTIFGYGEASGIPAIELKMVHNPAGGLGQNLGNVGLFLHELGHCLGLYHTGITFGPHPTGTPPIGAFPDDYWYEDSITWTRSCQIYSTNASNNIMSYSWNCIQYLSPQQLSIMHFNLATTFMASTVANLKCNVDTLQNTTINTNTTWSIVKYPKGNIIINPGKELIINCLVYMKLNSKIIVKQGAKLTIEGGTILGTCNGFWKGIEVWGASNLQQTIVSNMPVNQGMVVLKNNALIKDALVAITNAKKTSSGIDLTTTGGIIQSTGSSFTNNQIAVDFYTYNSYVSHTHLEEASFFKATVFNMNSNYVGTGINSPPVAHIRTDDVFGLKILGCNLSGEEYMYGILASNSRLIVKDYCSNPISSSSCGSTLVQNMFSHFGKCVYLYNTSSTNYSTIDHVIFQNSDGYINGGMYVNNVSNIQIINNEFDIDGGYSLSQTDYGLYLNNCTGYVVENNLFQGSYTGKNVGIYVNNSGPNANSIYNNRFITFKQDLWALNQNYDPSSGNGLVMNCNDFISSTFNVGIEKSGRYASGAPNNTGVNVVQGIANTAFETNNVRNTYNTPTCNTNAENKYYINTSNSFAITNHGSFLGSQFHATPQTSNSCSNSGEITDVVGTSGPLSSTKSTYCSVSNTSTFGSRMLNTALSGHKANRSVLSNSLAKVKLNSSNSEAQNQNSEMQNQKQVLSSQLQLAEREIGLLNNEKIRRFIADSNGVQYDSIMAIYSMSEMPGGKYNKVGFAIATAHYADAQTLINNLIAENADHTLFCNLQQMMLDMAINPAKITTWQQQANVKNMLLEKAQIANYLTEGLAIALLQKIYGITINEERIEPMESNVNENFKNRNAISGNDLIQLAEGISIYPNPANDVLQVKVETELTEAAIIKIADVMGNVLIEQTCNSNCSIKLTTLQNGIYFVNLYNAKQLISTKKIVVVK